ncbi:hypothetical protein K1719_036929 [Acacia pycnantha]|nr:hypothetical protein K1719_036929 [Acacia pycnantha]
MDYKNARDKDSKIDLEIGLTITVDDLRKISTPDGAGKGKTLFAKFSRDYVKGGDRSSLYCSESNLSGVHIVDVLNSVDSATKTIVKEKRKSCSNKKAPKPPRPPRAPSLDAADEKLIREISEFAMLKRARIERMKALKKMKAAKSTSSSSSCVFSMVFTIFFFFVIISQGMSSGKSPGASFPGSPEPAGGIEGAVISVQHELNPSAIYLNTPGSEPYNFVRPTKNAYLPEKQSRDTGGSAAWPLPPHDDDEDDASCCFLCNFPLLNCFRYVLRIRENGKRKFQGLSSFCF